MAKSKAIEPRVRFVQCMSPVGLHRMAYKEWGDPHNPATLVCVHGLTRVSDDFDTLAALLSTQYRVICPDVVGRGRSERLRDPQYYAIPQYVADMVTLLARLDVEQVDWLGTSMGGLIGIALAAQPAALIGKLVLNDIGPSLNAAAMTRIAEYVGQPRRFDSFDEARSYVQMISTSFGPHEEAQWRKLAADVLKEEEGGWKLAYDPALSISFKAMTPANVQASQQLLWAAYDAIQCPTLLLRGEHSDLLSRETAEEMTRRGPRARLIELPGIGHAPTLLVPAQINPIRAFLRP